MHTNEQATVQYIHQFAKLYISQISVYTFKIKLLRAPTKRQWQFIWLCYPLISTNLDCHFFSTWYVGHFVHNAIRPSSKLSYFLQIGSLQWIFFPVTDDLGLPVNFFWRSEISGIDFSLNLQLNIESNLMKKIFKTLFSIPLHQPSFLNATWKRGNGFVDQVSAL